MIARFLTVMIVAAFCGVAADPFSLIGTAVNTTDPQKSIAAPVQMVFAQDGTCVLTISPPLLGSGSCAISTYDAKSDRVEIRSTGAMTILWSGTAKGNFISGSYRIVASAESGSFYLAMVDRIPQEPMKAAPPPRPIPRSDAGCVPAIESAITGEVHGWDGETIFKLDNGQIWQQAEYDYTYFYEYHPDVTIYQTRGGCRMKVEDEDETIIVKRIK